MRGISMYKYDYNINANDYFKFAKFHNFCTPAGRKNVMANKTFMPLIAIYTVIVSFLVSRDVYIFAFEAISFTVLSFIWVVTTEKRITRNLWKNISKKTPDEMRKLFCCKGQITFDDEYITEITPDTETKMKYSQICAVYSTESYLLIYYKSVLAFILPDNVFSEELEKRRLINFINSKITDSSARCRT